MDDIDEQNSVELDNEDEKIRKELINYLSEIAENICAEENLKHEEKLIGGKCRKWVAWLEKQGEQKCEWSLQDEKKLDDVFISVRLNNSIKFFFLFLVLVSFLMCWYN